MTCRGVGLGLVLLLSLCAAPARADWDPFGIVLVPSGQDQGQIAQLQGSYIHPGAGHVYGESWSLNITELFDSEGNVSNTIRASYSGNTLGDSSVLLCAQHNTRCSRVQGFDSWTVENDLAGASCPAGYYQYRLSSAGAVFVLLRPYNIPLWDDTHGALSIHVIDGDNAGADLGRCTISFGSSAGSGIGVTTDDAHGQCVVPHVLEGNRTFWVQHDGYTTGQVTKAVVHGQTASVTVTMHAASAPTGGDTGGSSGGTTNVLDSGWWSNLFTTLFVPPQATWDEWTTFKNDVTSWGPFGFVSSFFSAWSTASRSGEDALVFDSHYTFAGGSQHLMDGKIDLRPQLETGFYTDGGQGSPWGTMLDMSRTTEGFGVYVLFAIALFKWLRPRLST
jgi:hypothetical protein